MTETSKKTQICSESEIDELLTRSVAQILPNKEVFKTVIQSGKRLRIYIGADATGPQLHLGHATNFIFLEKLRKLGHEIIILFGDFTAMIGDPTDKEAARVALSEDQVNEHIKTWKDQVGKIISFDDPENPAVILKNSKWLSILSFKEILFIASQFTVQQMMERDMFQVRLKNGKPIYLNEFLYPLMQGYDSVAMDVDVEVGGTDQTFNMLAGRTLQKKYHNKEKFVISTTLLENPITGKKLMSKSEGGFVALNDEPNEMFGKIMALPDQVMKQMFLDCTFVSMDEILKIEDEIKNGANPKNIKAKLAKEIVKIYHSEKDADEAEINFEKTFAEGNAPTDLSEIEADKEMKLVEIMLSEKIVESKTEWRRLVGAGAVTFMETGEKISDQEEKVKSGTYKIGKKRFLKIKIV